MVDVGNVVGIDLESRGSEVLDNDGPLHLAPDDDVVDGRVRLAHVAVVDLDRLEGARLRLLEALDRVVTGNNIKIRLSSGLTSRGTLPAIAVSWSAAEACERKSTCRNCSLLHELTNARSILSSSKARLSSSAACNPSSTTASTASLFFMSRRLFGAASITMTSELTTNDSARKSTSLSGISMISMLHEYEVCKIYSRCKKFSYHRN